MFTTNNTLRGLFDVDGRMSECDVVTGGFSLFCSASRLLSPNLLLNHRVVVSTFLRTWG